MNKTSLLSALAAVWLLVAPVLAAADGESWLTIAANKPRKKGKPARKKKPAKPAKEAAPAPKTTARTVQIQISTGDKPRRFLCLSQTIDGKTLRIESRDDGPIVVTRTERGKTVTRKFKNADELCKHDPQAYKLYKNVRITTEGKIPAHHLRASRGAIDAGPTVLIWPETMIPAGISLDVKGAASKAKAAGGCCGKEAASKAKAAADRCRKEAEIGRKHIEQQFEARRKACEQIHKRRLKQFEEFCARAKADFERTLKEIKKQVNRENDRHCRAMEELERLQKQAKQRSGK